MEDQNQNKNLILAMALSMGVILIWTFLFPPEQPPADPAASDPQAVSTVDENGNEVALAPPPAAGAEGAGTDAAPEELVETPRVEIETPSLSGSIALTGGRLDPADAEVAVTGDEEIARTVLGRLNVTP